MENNKLKILFFFFLLLIPISNALTFNLNVTDTINYNYSNAELYRFTGLVNAPDSQTAVVPNRTDLNYVTVNRNHITSFAVYTAGSQYLQNRSNQSLHNGNSVIMFYNNTRSYDNGLHYSTTNADDYVIVFDFLLDNYVYPYDISHITNTYDFWYDNGKAVYYGYHTLVDDTIVNNVSRTSHNLSGTTPFNRVVFYMYSNTGGSASTIEFMLKNIVFSNMYYNSTNFPEVNFTFNRTRECYNHTLGYAEFYPEIEVYDPEGDTIYYSVGDNLYGDYALVWDFEKTQKFLGITIKDRDYSPLDYVMNVTNECGTRDVLPYHENFLNIVSNDNVEYFDLLAQFNVGYALELRNNCAGSIKKLRFGVPYLLDKWYLDTSIYDLSNGENLTINILDSQLKEIFNITIVANATHYTWWNNGTQKYSSQYDEEFLTLSVTSRVSDDNYKIELLSVYGDTDNSITLDGYTSAHPNRMFYIEYDYTDLTEARLGSIGLGGQKYSPEWTTSVPTSADFRIYQPDTGDYYTLYVTDEIHINTSYWKDEVYLYADGSDDCFGVREQIDELVDRDLLEGNPILLLLDLFKGFENNAIRDFADDTGIDVILGRILYVVFGIVILYFVVKFKSIVKSLLVSGVLMIIFSYIFGYTMQNGYGHIAVGVITLALGSLMLLAQGGLDG